MDNNVKIFFGVIGLLILGVITTVLLRGGSNVPEGPGKYDEFATCLGEKGAVFYGAFWCPHCQATKKLFGNSAKLLPYVECSTADGTGQLQICKDKDIKTNQDSGFKMFPTTNINLREEDYERMKPTSTNSRHYRYFESSAPALTEKLGVEKLVVQKNMSFSEFSEAQFGGAREIARQNKELRDRLQ